MLHTYLTERLALRYPIVGAPMWGAAGGKLARAISRAGGLGVIGVAGSSPTSYIEEESAVARADDTPFGLGLMNWVIERRPELLDAAIAERPALISLSFGSPAPSVERVRAAGIPIATQVNTVAAAREAEQAGVDLIVAQGTEAGGHTGHAGTLPLLQAVLDAVEIPVLAAGGIATGRGLAAVLAAGAAGAWIGTAFLACPETAHSDDARRRILEALETDTILTHVFDRVQGIPWPVEFPGRALQNEFTREWHHHAQELDDDRTAAQQYEAARATKNHDIAVIYAGQAVGLVRAERPAAEVVRDIGEKAEQTLRGLCSVTLGGPETAG